MSIKKLLCKISFLSCEQYTEVASRRLDGDVPWHLLPSYYIHHVLCLVCRRFNRQITAIDAAAKKMALQSSGCCGSEAVCNEKDTAISSERKNQMAEAIKKAAIKKEQRNT